MKLIAFDYGATSGRGIVAEFDGKKLILGDEYRFDNTPVYLNNEYYWDFPSLLHHLKNGLRELSKDKEPDCIGIDTWGVDYGLLDENDSLLCMPYHYRDGRTDHTMEEFFKLISKKKLYDMTGIQLAQFNTVFQLYQQKKDRPWTIEKAKSLLFMPNLFNYYLTGKKENEFTIASTGQLLDPYTRDLHPELLKALEVDKDLFGSIAEPGTIHGTLSSVVQDELGLSAIKVANVAGHDTGSAVVAVPAKNNNFAYLSCGTWSLLGIESDKPIISDETFDLNLTNEGGVQGTYRVLKNIMGLWILTECQRSWAKKGFKPSYDEMEKATMETDGLRCFIDPDDGRFFKPGRMPEKVQDYCRETKQYVPKNENEILRCIKDSLAMKYRYAIEGLEKCWGREIDTLHIVGGGSRSATLCQFTANATGKDIVAGPAEGTALGNLMVQLMAMGAVKNLSEARQVLINSIETKVYEPEENWDMKYEEFLNVTKLKGE